MSIRYTWEQAIAESDLPTSAKCVGLCLATYSNAHGDNIFPGLETLARHCSLKVRATQYNLRKLEEAGLLKIVKRTDEDGRQKSNLYIPVVNGHSGVQPIAPTEVQPIAPTPVQPIAPITDQTNNRPNEQLPSVVDTPQNSDKGTPKNFRPPTPKERTEFMISFLQENIDEFEGKGWTEQKVKQQGEEFNDFYASKGWKVGNQSMKDWKAALRRWMRNGHAKGVKYSQPSRPKSKMQRAIDSLERFSQ